MTTTTQSTPLKACRDAFEAWLKTHGLIEVNWHEEGQSYSWLAFQHAWQSRAPIPAQPVGEDFYNGTIEDGLAIIEASFKRLQEQGVKSNYGITSAAIRQIRIAATTSQPLTADRQKALEALETVSHYLNNIGAPNDVWDAFEIAQSTALTSGWQTIDSAPKDGKKVLLYDPYRGIGDGYFCNLRWWFYECGDDWYSEECNPTHWMPLPTPPTTNEGEG